MWKYKRPETSDSSLDPKFLYNIESYLTYLPKIITNFVKTIKYNTTLANYIPVDGPAEPNPPPNLEMSVCVDFNEKNCYVGREPLVVNAYLKFNSGNF